ncbi:DNA starvation/stationary phase protection protein [Microlunatus elymi]|uniref:DNA starvation/stationary phase protection protein n=1 Tax=Microlunatus elymi TaxID=2596828 RepID=A0A516Q227_9ACTN|nr:DNA starvation/stationary phase protection protein [Microlunatus elymi]QDP97489.1 DNA starvation/stationary phase protection protein [Microlunatus elymi]
MAEQNVKYTTPGMEKKDAEQIIDILQKRLNCYNDLQLTLKHVHWNVVGPHFIAVHEMIDPHVEEVRAMVDATAERIATLGGSPQGTPGSLVADRTWNDYEIGRATTQEHLAALDVVYRGIIADTRTAIEDLESLDPVTQDMIIADAQKLELFHWFVRAHLEDPSGRLSTTDGSSNKSRATSKSS